MAEIIGTAFVRIRAITAGLGSEIKDGFDKGVKDAKADESGKAAGKDFVGGMGDETEKGMPGALGGAMDGAERDLDMPGRGERGGREYVKGTKKGADDETKRRNPFSSIGKSFDKLMTKFKMPGGWKGWAFTLGLPALGGALKLAASYIGGLVALLGNLATAALGAGAALAGIGVGLIPGVAALMLAFKAETPALEGFKESLKELGETWQQVGEATQEGLLPGLERAATTLTERLVPIMTEFGSKLGNIVGPLADFAAQALTSESNMDAFSKILDSSTRLFATFGRILARLADSLPKLFADAMPLAEDFALAIERMVTKFQDFINRTHESGELSENLNTWWVRAKRFGRVLGNVATGLWNIFEIGADAADPLLRRMVRITRQFEKWTESTEGKDQIKQFFKNAMPVMREFNRLLGEIITMIGEPILTGDTEGVIGFLRIIRTDFLPILQELAEAFSGPEITAALETLALSFLELVKSAQDAGAIGAFARALTDVFEAIKFLLDLPGLGPVIGELLKFMAIMKAVTLITPLSGKMISNFAMGLLQMQGAEGIMGALGSALTPVIAALLALAAAVAAVWAVWHFWDQIVDGLEAAWEWFTKLAAPLQGLVGALAVFFQFFAGPISLLIQFAEGLLAVVAALKNWETISEIFSNAWEAISGFFTGLPEMMADFITGIPEALAGAGEAILNFFTSLPDLITQGLSSLGGLAVELGAALGNLLLDALQAMPGFAADFGLWLVDQIIAGLGALGGLATSIGSALLDLFVQAVGQLAEWSISIPAQIATWIGQGLFNLAQVGVDVIGQILVFLASALPALFTFFLTLPVKIANWIVEGIAALIPIGVDIIQAIVEGLIAALPAIVRFFSRLPGMIIRTVTRAIKLLFNVGKAIITGLWDGLVAAAPIIANFFRNLPRAILSLLLDAGTWLVSVGWSIIQGLWRGITTGAQTVWAFLQTVPSRLGQIFSSAGSWLLQAGAALIRGLISGAQQIFGAFNDLFANLPQKLLNLIVAGAGFLARAGSSLVRWILQGVRSIAETLWTFFRQLPGRLAGFIIAGLARVVGAGRRVLSSILQGVREVAETLWTWFRQAPGRAADLIINGLSRLVGAGRRVLNSIKDGIIEVAQNLWNWFREMPGKAVGFIADQLYRFLGTGRNIVNKIKDGLIEVAQNLWDWFTDLPSKAADLIEGGLSALVGVGEAIVNAIVEGITNIGGAIKDKVMSFIPDKSDIPLIGRFLEMGGIIYGPTVSVLGEAGPEAVIPLTKPQRALEIMRASGLTNLARRGSGPRLQPTIVSPVGETTLVKIDNAVFVQPVDLDMLLAKVPHAYNVMTGRAGWR